MDWLLLVLLVLLVLGFDSVISILPFWAAAR
jgi:hypothetical protein